MQSMEKTISEVHSLLIEFKKSIKRNKQPIIGASSTPQVMAIQGGRVQKYKPQSKAKGKGKEVKMLHLLIQGLRGAKKLKRGSLYLYVGNVLVQTVAATNDSPAIPEHTTVETPMNMSPENKAHFQAEKEAIHLILTEIRDEIYLTVDACQIAHEMWEAIERLQQGKSLNIQDYFKNIYKPTNNNLRTSSNSRNKNVDTTLRYKNDNQSGQFGNQRTVNVVGARENVGSPVVQQSGIQCFNCKEFGHFAKECRKPKRVKDSAYHKEKMLLCKQAEQGVLLQAEQYDWLADTDEEVNEQELEAHYSYMAKIQEVPTTDSGIDSEPLEQVQNDAGYNVFANELQHSEQSESISNPCLVETDDSNVIPDSLDMCNDDIQNDQNDVESDDEQTSKTLRESNSVQDSCLVALQTKQAEFEKYEAFNDRTIDYDKLEQIVDNAWIKHSKDQFRAPTAQDMEIPIQTYLMPLATKTRNDSFLFVHELKQEMHVDLKYVESLEKEIEELESDKAEFSNMYDMILQEKKHSISLEIALQKCKEQVKNDTVWNEKASNVFQKEREQYFEIQDLKAQLQDKNIAMSELKKLIEKGKGKSVDTKFDKPFVVRQPNAQRIPKPSVLDSLNSRTLNANAKCLVDSNHFACVTKMLNDMNARTKKPNVVPISTRKPKAHVNKSITIPHKKKVASKSTNQKPQSYFRMLYENSSKTWKWWIIQQSPLGYKWVPKAKMQWVPKAKNEKVQKRVSFAVDNVSRITNKVYQNQSLHRLYLKQQGKLDLQGNDLLTDNHGSDLYTISLQESTSSTQLCLMAKASPTQAWLWHRRLSHLNFDYINPLSKKDIVIGLPKLKFVKDQLCSSCELSKAKRSSFKSKSVPSSKGRLNLLYMDLCGPIQVRIVFNFIKSAKSRANSTQE
nr:retrovirus-related Pol polyprotein from transposon TNT 1-94 [Tanacetum cinerariifolium]